MFWIPCFLSRLPLVYSSFSLEGVTSAISDTPLSLHLHPTLDVLRARLDLPSGRPWQQTPVSSTHNPSPPPRTSSDDRAAPPQASFPYTSVFLPVGLLGTVVCELSEVKPSPGTPLPTTQSGEMEPESPGTEPTRPRPWQMGAQLSVSFPWDINYGEEGGHSLDADGNFPVHFAQTRSNRSRKQQPPPSLSVCSSQE